MANSYVPSSLEEAANLLARRKVAAAQVGGFYKKADPVNSADASFMQQMLLPVGIGAGVGGLGGLLLGRRSKRRVNPLWTALGGAGLGAGLGAGGAALMNSGVLSNPTLHNIQGHGTPQSDEVASRFNALNPAQKIRAAQEQALYQRGGALGLLVGRAGGNTGISAMNGLLDWANGPSTDPGAAAPAASIGPGAAQLAGEVLTNTGKKLNEDFSRQHPFDVALGGTAGLATAYTGARGDAATRIGEWHVNPKGEALLRGADGKGALPTKAPPGLEPMLRDIKSVNQTGLGAALSPIPGASKFMRGLRYQQHMRQMTPDARKSVHAMLADTKNMSFPGRVARGITGAAVGLAAGRPIRNLLGLGNGAQPQQ